MKNKILSIALVLGMMLSLSSIIPVGAATTAPADSLPYFFHDFEDGTSIFSQSNTQIVDGGIGGSGKALLITEGNTDTCKDYHIKNSAGQYLSGTIPAGATVKVSFWVKLSCALAQCDFSIISFDMSSKIGYPKGTGDKDSTDWQKVEITFSPSADATFSNMMFRTGNTGATCNAQAGKTHTAPGDRSYLIDDFEITMYKEGIIKPDSFASLENYYVGFEKGNGSVRIMIPNTGYPNVQSTSRGNSNETFQVVDNPAGNGKVMKYDMVDTVAGDAVSLALTASTATGNWGGNNRPTSVVPAGKTLTVSFDYYWAQEMSTENTPAFCIYATNGKWVTGSDFSAVANTWHTATFTYTNETTADVEVGQLVIRFCAQNAPNTTWTKKTLATGETTYGARTIYIDEIKANIGGESTGTGTGAKAPVTDTLSLKSGDFNAGSTVEFAQNFTSENEGATDKSIVKLVNKDASGRKGTLAYASINGVMTVPALPESGELLFEVISIDSTDAVSNIINTYTYAEVVGFVASLTLGDFEADGSITAKVNMENQKHDGSGVNAVLVVLMYDAQGALVKFDTKAMICPYGTEISEDTEAGTLTLASDTEDPSLSNVKSAEAYLWDCGTEALPTFKNTTMKEIAPDCIATK